MRLVVLAIVLSSAVAHADALLDRLGGPEPGDAIREVERAPAPGPDAMYAAARAADEALHDPARALALYDRVVRETPDARFAVAAGKRAAELRAQVGDRGGTYAATLAALVAGADARPSGEVERALAELEAASWPGAPDAALFHAHWLRRSGRFAAADARYVAVAARYAGTPTARAALRGRAGIALDTRAWGDALARANELPIATAVDRLERDDIVAAAERGRLHDRVYVAAWIVVAIVGAGLLAGLGLAIRRARRRPRLPIELAYLAPVSAVLIGVAFTAHRLIAPAVATIAIGGLALAAISGATLDLVRDLGRPVRARAVANAALCALAVVALGYIAMTRDGLLDTLLETVRFGPEG